MKKILIADDTTANLDAAKEAAALFPEYEFVFTNSANEAFQMLPNVDAVVTDLFFKEEATGDLAAAYQLYVEQVKPELLLPHERLADYAKDMEASLEVLRTGMPKEAIRKVFSRFASVSAEKIESEIAKLQKEFPLGGTIMVSAKEQGKRLCLVSNVHRHAGGYSDSASSAAAVVLLAPLLEVILTADQLLYDGGGSLTYLGGDEIRKYDEKNEGTHDKKGKTDPAVWTEAISRVLAQ